MDRYESTAELPYNNWLILPKGTDSEDSYSGSTPRKTIAKRGLHTLFIRGVLGALFVSLPLAAHAGVFSYVASLFGGTESAQAQVATPHNSQTMPLLQAALNIDPNPAKGGGEVIVVGGTSLLSEAGPSGTIADIEERPATSDQISVYVVREGDTLSQIAELFNVSVNTIRWANDIDIKESIQPGETLVILPVSGVRHTVKSGDTLKSIVAKYEGHIEEVLQYNGLSEDATLAVGDVIVVPNGEIPTPSGSSAARTITQRSSGSSVAVSSGYFIRPVDGIKTQGVHGYNGIDTGAPAGTPIVAAAAGEVIVSRGSGWNGGYGLYIVIRHNNGTQTLYAHNSRNIVYPGDRVVQGQVIGYVGSTGRSTGNHLHFEVRGARNPF